MSLLLQHGIDINVADSTGRTSLGLASRFGFDNIVLLLLQAGALVDVPDNVTTLYFACGIGHLKCVVLLVEHGADVNKCAANKSTPLTNSAVLPMEDMMLSHICLHKERISIIRVKPT